MQNNARIGGILSIISGAFGILWLVGTIFMVYFFNALVRLSPQIYPYDGTQFMNLMAWFYLAWGIAFALVGILGIVGGVFALKRKYWGLALAGSIAGTVTFFPVGISAIIYTAIAKPEFALKVEPPPAPATTASV